MLYNMTNIRQIPTLARDFEHAGISFAIRRILWTKPQWHCLPTWLLPGGSQGEANVEWKRMTDHSRVLLIRAMLCNQLREVTRTDDELVDLFRCARTAQLAFAIELEAHSSKLCDAALNPSTMFDSYACATWTSCVAMASHFDTVALPEAKFVSSTIHDVHLHLVCCQHSEQIPSAQLEGVCFNTEDSSFMHPLQLLFQRATQHAMRGWRRSLQALIASNNGVANFVIESMITSFSGLHPAIAPSHRPNWEARLYVQLNARATLESNKYAAIGVMNSICKDSMRRSLTAMVHSSIAVGVVARRLKTSTRHYEMPPLDMPSANLVRQMIVAARQATNAYQKGTSLLEEVQNCEQAVLHPPDRSLAGNSNIITANNSRTAVSFVNRISNACFQSNFVPFWMVASVMNARPHQLNQYQHDAFHRELNSCQQMLDMGIDESTGARICNLVLSKPQCGVVDVATACKMLGVARPLNVTNFVGGRNNAQRQIDHDYSIVKSLTPQEVAELICFGTIAAIAEKLLVVELGEETRQAHIRAIKNRFELDTEEQVITQMKHLSTINVCTTCERIANCVAPSHIDVESDSTPFQRVGVYRTSVAPTNNSSNPPTFYCSNRCSAAFKHAMASQLKSEEMAIENDMPTEESRFKSCEETIMSMAHDGTLASRMRRDSKRAMRQSRVVKPCGTLPMFSSDILGRAIRINEQWYTLCCYWANFICINSFNRDNGTFCCLHCPNSSAFRSNGLGQSHTHKVDVNAPNTCRFCEEHVTRSVSYASPHDTFKWNASRLPSERVTHWCRKHNRPWLQEALSVIDTPVLIAHIAMNTHPTFNSQ